VSGALVHGQLVIVEGAEMDRVPLIVIDIQCDICGTYSIVLAAHHAKAVGRVLQDCIADLPEELTADEGLDVPLRRPRKPENN
jgi:hypothetical protein